MQQMRGKGSGPKQGPYSDSPDEYTQEDRQDREQDSLCNLYNQRSLGRIGVTAVALLVPKGKGPIPNLGEDGSYTDLSIDMEDELCQQQ